MPSASPSARTDCPSTASRRDGQQTRHESGTPCRLPQETHDTPSTTARRTRRPYAVNLPAQIEQPEPAGNREDIRRGEEEHEGRKSEKMRTCARLPAVLPLKSYINRTPPPNGQPSTAPGQQAPQPAPAEAPSLPTFSRPFPSLSILLLESLQNPGPFSPVSRRTTAPPPACLDATGTGGAFTFSRPLRFSRNGSVPPLYHVRPISPFFTREQSRRFPNNK